MLGSPIALEHRFGRAYVKVCLVVSLLGWLPLFFTQPMMHGGTLFDVTLMWVGFVLGAYCTIELIRLSRNRWTKLALVIWLAPYALVIGFGLYKAVPYVPRLFAT